MSLLLSVLLLTSAASWDCQQDEGGLWHCYPRQPATAPVPKPVPVPVTVTVPVPADAYVVQVGAFRFREEALQAVDSPAARAVTITAIRRDDIHWWVLLLGSYPDYHSARAAGESWLQLGPEADYWIRDAAQLSELRVAAGVDAPAR